MNRRTAFVMASLVLAFLVGPAVANAGDLLISDIPFKFVAAGKSHDPGTYRMRVSEDLKSVVLKPSDEFVMVLTRLAEPDPPIEGARVVFDKVGDTYTLSELWVPGEEGFLLHVTQGEHTHHAVKLRKEAK